MLSNKAGLRADDFGFATEAADVHVNYCYLGSFSHDEEEDGFQFYSQGIYKTDSRDIGFGESTEQVLKRHSSITNGTAHRKQVPEYSYAQLSGSNDDYQLSNSASLAINGDGRVSPTELMMIQQNQYVEQHYPSAFRSEGLSGSQIDNQNILPMVGSTQQQVSLLQTQLLLLQQQQQQYHHQQLQIQLQQNLTQQQLIQQQIQQLSSSPMLPPLLSPTSLSPFVSPLGSPVGTPSAGFGGNLTNSTNPPESSDHQPSSSLPGASIPSSVAAVRNTSNLHLQKPNEASLKSNEKNASTKSSLAGSKLPSGGLPRKLENPSDNKKQKPGENHKKPTDVSKIKSKMREAYMISREDHYRLLLQKLPLVKAHFHNYEDILFHWENVRGHVSNVPGGICVFVSLPYMQSVQIELVPVRSSVQSLQDSWRSFWNKFSFTNQSKGADNVMNNNKDVSGKSDENRTLGLNAVKSAEPIPDSSRKSSKKKKKQKGLSEEDAILLEMDRAQAEQNQIERLRRNVDAVMISQRMSLRIFAERTRRMLQSLQPDPLDREINTTYCGNFEMDFRLPISLHHWYHRLSSQQDRDDWAAYMSKRFLSHRYNKHTGMLAVYVDEIRIRETDEYEDIPKRSNMPAPSVDASVKPANVVASTENGSEEKKELHKPLPATVYSREGYVTAPPSTVVNDVADAKYTVNTTTEAKNTETAGKAQVATRAGESTIVLVGNKQQADEPLSNKSDGAVVRGTLLKEDSRQPAVVGVKLVPVPLDISNKPPSKKELLATSSQEIAPQSAADDRVETKQAKKKKPKALLIIEKQQRKLQKAMDGSSRKKKRHSKHSTSNSDIKDSKDGNGDIVQQSLEKKPLSRNNSNKGVISPPSPSTSQRQIVLTDPATPLSPTMSIVPSPLPSPLPPIHAASSKAQSGVETRPGQFPNLNSPSEAANVKGNASKGRAGLPPLSPLASHNKSTSALNGSPAIFNQTFIMSPASSYDENDYRTNNRSSDIMDGDGSGEDDDSGSEDDLSLNDDELFSEEEEEEDEEEGDEDDYGVIENDEGLDPYSSSLLLPARHHTTSMLSDNDLRNASSDSMEMERVLEYQHLALMSSSSHSPSHPAPPLMREDVKKDKAAAKPFLPPIYDRSYSQGAVMRQEKQDLSKTELKSAQSFSNSQLPKESQQSKNRSPLLKQSFKNMAKSRYLEDSDGSGSMPTPQDKKQFMSVKAYTPASAHGSSSASVAHNRSNENEFKQQYEFSSNSDDSMKPAVHQTNRIIVSKEEVYGSDTTNSSPASSPVIVRKLSQQRWRQVNSNDGKV